MCKWSLVNTPRSDLQKTLYKEYSVILKLREAFKESWHHYFQLLCWYILREKWGINRFFWWLAGLFSQISWRWSSSDIPTTALPTWGKETGSAGTFEQMFVQIFVNNHKYVHKYLQSQYSCTYLCKCLWSQVFVQIFVQIFVLFLKMFVNFHKCVHKYFYKYVNKYV